jgi:effector-binding domain-containing protein
MLPFRLAAGVAILLVACGLAAVPAAGQDAGGAPAAKATTPGTAAPAQPAVKDPFGEEVTLPERKIVYLKGAGNWDSAFETLVDAFKSVYGYLEKEGIKPAGLPLTIYTQADDVGFEYEAAVPITQEPKVAPQGDIEIGQAPSGKALKFVHRGSYDAMDTTYEAITNYLDEKQLEAKDIFVEEYVTDPVKTPEEQLVVNIYVPTK